jgi:hypothetical protein
MRRGRAVHVLAVTRRGVLVRLGGLALEQTTNQDLVTMTIYDYVILYFALGAVMALVLMLACVPANPRPIRLVVAFVAWPWVVGLFVGFARDAIRESRAP